MSDDMIEYSCQECERSFMGYSDEGDYMCSACSKREKRNTFVYLPPEGILIAQDATLGVKFAQRRVILDPWYLRGGTPWTRTLFRLRHPIVYSKRGLRNLYRRVKRIFVKERMRQCKPECKPGKNSWKQ